MESQAPAPCWSNIVKQNPVESPTQPPITTKLLETCKSTKGIAVAVVDEVGLMLEFKISW